MFAPSQNDVRRFFCETQRKRREHAPLTPMESIAADWIAEHPEYHAELDDLDAALAAVYDVESGRTNPFLHLSMHLTISEQISIASSRSSASQRWASEQSPWKTNQTFGTSDAATSSRITLVSSVSIARFGHSSVTSTPS